MGSQAELVRKVEMIGELEINVLLLPERSRAERAWLAKKQTIPIVMPSGARQQRHGAKQHSGYIGRGKSGYYAFLLISCRPRRGTWPGWLGEIQAVTDAGILQVTC
jgi:hypothetical protein